MHFLFVFFISLLILASVGSMKMEKKPNNDDMMSKEEEEAEKMAGLRSTLAAYLVGQERWKEAIVVTESMGEDEHGNIALSQLPEDLEAMLKEVEGMNIDPRAAGKKKKEQEEKERKITTLIKSIVAFII